MDKKYQIFVSSTFVDLKEERQAVLSAVQVVGDIPSGMELFPATDEEQFNFIKRIIDNSDYYVLIVAGRYGSVASDGVSYTEKEYDYAVSKGIHVLAFVRNEEAITVENRETDPSKIQKLKALKEKVQTGRVVRSWNQKSDLVSSVLTSLFQEKEYYPAAGWIRANKVLSSENMVELSQLRKEVAELRDYKLQQEAKRYVDNIADFDDAITLNFKHNYWSGYTHSDIHSPKQTTVSWRVLFAQIAPSIMQCPNDALMKQTIGKIYKTIFQLSNGTVDIEDLDYETIKLQFIAYGLVEVKNRPTTTGTQALFWNLTPKGQRVMMENRVIKKN